MCIAILLVPTSMRSQITGSSARHRPPTLALTARVAPPCWKSPRRHAPEKPPHETSINGDQKQKLIIDLSVPHNVAKTIAENFDIQYVDVENLRNLAKENIAFRENEVVVVKAMSAKNLEAFHTTYRQRQIERAMQSVPQEIKEVKTHAMNNVFKKELENLDEHSRELLERMMSYMERRCISIPMQAAKNTQI